MPELSEDDLTELVDAAELVGDCVQFLSSAQPLWRWGQMARVTAARYGGGAYNGGDGVALRVLFTPEGARAPVRRWILPALVERVDASDCDACMGKGQQGCHACDWLGAVPFVESPDV